MNLSGKALTALLIALLAGGVAAQENKDKGPAQQAAGKAQEHPDKAKEHQGKAGEHEGKAKVREEKLEEHQGKGKVREEKAKEHEGKIDEHSPKAKGQVGEDAVGKAGKAEERARGNGATGTEDPQERELVEAMMRHRDEMREREAKIARLRELAAEKNDPALKAKADDAEAKLKAAEAKKEAALREKYGDAKVDQAKAKAEQRLQEKRGEKAKHLENKGQNQTKEGTNP